MPGYLAAIADEVTKNVCQKLRLSLNKGIGPYIRKSLEHQIVYDKPA